MTDANPQRAVVLGGAGFIGSRIALALSNAGWRVTVIDGFLPQTGATRENLVGANNIALIESRAEDVTGLSGLIDNALIVDAMGWTRHREATENPVHDLALNVASHLPLVLAIREAQPKLVLFLGSRHQYGRVATARIDEDTPLAPVDVHSIHKIAAEMHYRLVTNAPVISLRFGNTFGPGQPMVGEDIGLIGGFIRNLLEEKPIALFAGSRRRDCLFVDDLAQIILNLAAIEHTGFAAYNVSGHDVTVGRLASSVTNAVGHGVIVEEEMPSQIAAIEVGAAVFDGTRLHALLGSSKQTPLDAALRVTIQDARARLFRQEQLGR